MQVVNNFVVQLLTKCFRIQFRRNIPTRDTIFVHLGKIVDTRIRVNDR